MPDFFGPAERLLARARWPMTAAAVFAAGVAAVGVVGLLLPDDALDDGTGPAAVARHRFYARCGVGGGLAALAGLAAYAVRGHLGDENRPARLRKRLQETLRSLDQQENAVLWEFVNRDERTRYLPAGSPVLRSLVVRGLLDCDRPAALGSSAFSCHFSVRPEVWDYLQGVRHGRR